MARALVGFFALALLLSPGVIAHAALPAEAAAEAATVNVYCTYKSGNKLYSSTGSGFFIDSRGVIMTNAHVAIPFLLSDKKGKSLSDCTIRTGSPAKDRYTARVLYISSSWVEENLPELRKGKPRGTGEGDVALLLVTGAVKGTLPTSFPALPLSTIGGGVAEGDTLIAAGYPAEDLTYKQVRRKLKLVTTTPELSSVRYFIRPFADVLIITPSAASAPGVSGGPVLSTTGQVIAMTTAVEGGKDIEERSIRAITMDYANRFFTQSALRSLLLLPSTDLTLLNEQTDASLTDDLRSDLRKALLKRR